MVRKFDFIVVGSGIAGMSFALKVAHKGKVAILCKSKLEEANTHYAQGGIASVTNETDNFEKHISDTLIAGDGHCDEEVVRKVVENAPREIEALVNWQKATSTYTKRAVTQSFVSFTTRIALAQRYSLHLLKESSNILI